MHSPFASDASAKSPNMDELLKIFLEVMPREKSRLLEIGTGSGHHAVHIARHLPELQWVTSDVPYRHKAIQKTLRAAKLPNVHGPIEFEVGKDEFPKQKFTAAFASQFFHVVSWKEGKSLIKMLGNRLRRGSPVLFYGPFRYETKLASERLEEQDRSLKEHDAQSGIRAFEDVARAMTKAGFVLKKDYTLPNENHVLYFERLEHLEVKPQARPS